MFQNTELKKFLDTSYTVRSNPKIYAEINLNRFENIERIGNYRHRPNDFVVKYRALPATYDPYDYGDYYTDSTISYAEIGGTYETGTDLSYQTIFRQDNDVLGSLYSLEDCFRRNRPRSGINKLLYLGSGGISRSTPQFIDGSSDNPSARPRFYISSKDDYFKYWTSYKMEGNIERGISKKVGSSFPIDDVAPFVVYKNEVPANRIVIKMQTLVGEESVGPVYHNGTYIDDPFFGSSKAHVPRNWQVQTLRNGTWSTAYSFTGASEIPSDGHVELGYGIVVPSKYLNNYMYRGELVSTSLLPEDAVAGDLYLVRKMEAELGQFFIAIDVDGSIAWDNFIPEYGWTLEKDGFSGQSRVVTDIVNPRFYGTDNLTFREFQMIGGIRLVVSSMNVQDATFDLIELSPRLVMDWTNRTESFDITKSMADLSGSALPIGTLLASTGSISVSNDDLAFNKGYSFDPKTGSGSILHDLQSQSIKIMFYETILDANGYDYYIPIKTLYTESTPELNNDFSKISFSLRDLYFLFESVAAPSLIMTDVSLSRAIMTIMDYVGFTNYTFKRNPNQSDPVIPYFFIQDGRNIAEIMIDLAMATQSAMYFDEQNNLVIALKEYILPAAGERDSDIVVSGNDTDDFLASIKEISSTTREVYNAGSIDYTKRCIQRTYGSLGQSIYQPNDKTWIYAPSLLWEASGDETTKAVNESGGEQQNYTLTAMPLSRSLSAEVPTVSGGVIVNNTIDVGEAANYVARYNGYLYANGEIIRYDAVQYSVAGTGNVWINSADEYQNYMLALPFNGKMYPTGLIRIWCEPYYTSLADGTTILQSGNVRKHGRAQFGTSITSHQAGIGSHWSDNANVKGIIQNADSLFDMKEKPQYQAGLMQNSVAGNVRGNLDAGTLAKQSTRNGIMKHNMSQKFWSESELGRMTSAKAGTIQSSAFIFAGPAFPADANPRDHVSYVHKPLSSYYTNFGTRCRIIGKVEAGSSIDQNPIGASTYFAVPSTKPSSQTSISGGSGGIAINVDPSTNAGYFFEIAALTSADPSSYDIPEIEIETNLGKITSATIMDNIVNLTIDQTELKTIPDLDLYDLISVSSVSSTYYTGEGELREAHTVPNINGTFRVENITNNGTVLVYTIPIIGYTWLSSFGTVTKNGVDLGEVISASVDENNIATIVMAMPTGVYKDDLITVTGFETSGSIPLINNENIKVVFSSTDTRTIKFEIPKKNGTLPIDVFVNSELKRLTNEQAKLSNIWFYKTVADDLGGHVLSFTRTAAYTEVTVDSHRLSTNDFVVIKLDSSHPINGTYQISSISGNTIRLNRGGSTLTGGFAPSTSKNTIGLIHPVATTYKLWSGLSNILVDSGQFWGQYRTVAEDATTVYDLNIEYVDSTYGRTFYLYINNKQVATVIDKEPLAKVNNMALFIRGRSKLMFENVYALGENITRNTVSKQIEPGVISTVFGIPDGINESEAMRKYAVSGFVQSSYLSGITNKYGPQYNMYYDEFGTIMREAAYFNIKYDKAYPALYAKIAPTLNRLKGYTVSGFYAGAYGAEFMVFNNLDNLCSLDTTTGNYLRIVGVTFTQSTTKTLTVDDYLKDTSYGADGQTIISDPNRKSELYDKVKMSRIQHGVREFAVSSDYIQTDDAANNMMKWIIEKVYRPRLNIGISIFQNPMIQLGDLVSIYYVDDDNNYVITDPNKQFVVYSINYTKSESDSSMTIYVTET